MTIDFDHLFIFTAFEAPAVDRLVEFGLTEGEPNIHPGQGTANRRIFFHNAMLELLWVHNEPEVRSQVIRPTRLWERSRYRQTGYSPFGIAFRTAAQTESGAVDLPFETWPYRPPYLPDHLKIDVARNQRYVGEPMLFYIPFGRRPEEYPPERRQPLEHAAGFKEVTGLRIGMPPASATSAALRAVERAGLVSFETSREHVADLFFDHGSNGRQADFRPDLPLVIHW